MVMMKLGFVSAIVPDFSLEEVLDFAAKERFETVELCCWPKGKAERRYAGVTHIDVADFSDEDAAKVKKLVQERGLTISGLGYYPNPLDEDLVKREFYLAHIKKLIDAASRL